MVTKLEIGMLWSRYAGFSALDLPSLQGMNLESLTFGQRHSRLTHWSNLILGNVTEGFEFTKLN
jgi:hypothetical protein